MKYIRLNSTCGHSWTTEINGSNGDIESYYLNKYFNVGITEDKLVLVESMEWLDNEVLV